MELGAAIKSVQTRVTMVLSELHDKFSAEYGDDLQKVAKSHNALNMIHQGISELAALGHRYDLVEWTPGQTIIFPQMIYRRTDSGSVEEKIVNSSEELEQSLGEGWKENPNAE